MIRRSLFKMFGGAVAGAAAVRSGAAQVASAAPIPIRSALGGALGSAMECSTPYGGDDHDRKWNLYNEWLRPTRRAERRKELASQFLGGYPADIATNHSWSPAYKALAASRRIQNSEEEGSTFREMIRKKIFG